MNIRVLINAMIDDLVIFYSSIGAIACSSGRIRICVIGLELNRNGALLYEVSVSMHPLPWHWHYDA